MIEDIRLSFKGIWSHKLRSFLTMLGIIVGVAAVIAVVSTINGTNQQIKDNLIGDGTNTVDIAVYQNGWEADYSYEEIPDGVPELGENEIQKIKSLDHVVNASAYHIMPSANSLYYMNNSLDGTAICGIDSNYLATEGLQVIKGRGFSSSDLKDQKKVALIDDSVQTSAFDGDDPIGKILDINGEPFLVLGVVDKKSEFEPVITSMDDYYTYMEMSSGTVYIPDQIWPVVSRYDEPRKFVVKADSTDSMTEVGKNTADYLNSLLTVSEDSNTKYQSKNLAEEASQIQQLSSSTNVLLIGIASISLLVGGIGVMNIMLVSVTERTREIGLKKALGAKKSRIQRQFLTEAIILSGFGGILGVIAGIILAKIISAIAEVPSVISIPSVIVAVVFSMVIGVAFGILPSIKASKLNPIEALRYE